MIIALLSAVSASRPCRDGESRQGASCPTRPPSAMMHAHPMASRRRPFCSRGSVPSSGAPVELPDGAHESEPDPCVIPFPSAAERDERRQSRQTPE